MKKHKTLLPLLALLAFVTFGCETVINVDLPEHEPTLVANGIFLPDSSFAIYLGNTVSVLDTLDPEAVEGATVEISDDAGNSWVLQDNGFGEYRLDSVSPEIDVTYELKVNAPGYPELTGIDRIPNQVPITGFTLTDSVQVGEFDEVEAELELRWTDDSAEDNYYFVTLGYTDTATSTFDTLIFFDPIWWYSDDPAIDEADLEGLGYALSDASFPGREKILKMRFESFYLHHSNNRHLVVMLATISKDFYLYKRSTLSHERAGFNPFAEPAPLHSNVNGGYGIFAGYSVFPMPIN